MLAGERGRCRCLRCGAAFGRNLFHFRFRGGRGRVELLGHETENGLRIRALCEWRSARSRARAYLEFGFLVELESIVDGAIKMDRCEPDASDLRLRGKQELLTQTRNPQDGSLNMDQLCHVLICASLENDPSRQTQVSIKPRRPSTSAIRFRVDHDVSRLFLLAHRSNLEAWRVGMAGDNAESRSLSQLARDDKRKQGRLVPGLIVLSSRNNSSALER